MMQKTVANSQACNDEHIKHFRCFFVKYFWACVCIFTTTNMSVLATVFALSGLGGAVNSATNNERDLWRNKTQKIAKEISSRCKTHLHFSSFFFFETKNVRPKYLTTWETIQTCMKTGTEAQENIRGRRFSHQPATFAPSPFNRPNCKNPLNVLASSVPLCFWEQTDKEQTPSSVRFIEFSVLFLKFHPPWFKLTLIL